MTDQEPAPTAHGASYGAIRGWIKGIIGEKSVSGSKQGLSPDMYKRIEVLNG